MKLWLIYPKTLPGTKSYDRVNAVIVRAETAERAIELARAEAANETPEAYGVECAEELLADGEEGIVLTDYEEP